MISVYFKLRSSCCMKLESLSHRSADKLFRISESKAPYNAVFPIIRVVLGASSRIEFGARLEGDKR